MKARLYFWGIICGVILTCTIPVNTTADILAAWDVNEIKVSTGTGIESASAPYTFYATTAAEQMTAQLALGAGVNPSTAEDQYGFKISAANSTISLTAAIANNHYLEFSLQINSGYELTLSSITMNGESTGAGCSDVALLSSIDGFTAGQEIEQTHNVDEDGFGNPINLIDPTYAGIKGTVTFRLYGWNSTSGSGVTRIRNLSGDDLVINGTIEAIPEPAVIGFISLTSLGLIVVRRWFR